MPKALKLALRVAVSLGLIAWLLTRIDTTSLGRLIADANPLFYAAALAILTLMVLINAYRWRMLAGERLKFGEALSYLFMGNFASNFLPTSFGGDWVRVMLLRPHVGNWSHAVALTFWDRYTGLLGLVIVGGGAYLLSFPLISATPVVWLYPTVFFGALLAYPLYGLLARKRFEEMSLEKVGLAKKVVFRAVAMSLFQSTLGSLTVYMIARSLNLSITLTDCFLFAPLTSIVTLVPVSVSGIGLREGAAVYLFGLTKTPPHEAMALSLAWFAAMVIVSLWGSVEYMRKKERVAEEERKPHESE